ILAERIVAELTTHKSNETWQVSVAVKPDNSAYTIPQISVLRDCTNDMWTATSLTNATAARLQHTAVWTGSEMIVWGGYAVGVSALNTGGRYNPSTDSWTAISTTNAPAGRYIHTAVWTGSEMIVWGGGAGSTDFNT